MSIKTAAMIQQPHPDPPDDESNLAVRASIRQMVRGRGRTAQGTSTTSTVSKTEKIELTHGKKRGTQDRYPRKDFKLRSRRQ